MSDAAATPRRDQRAHVRSIVLAAIALALIVLAWAFDWNWFKGPLERRVSAITGHEFSIDGDLDVDLGRVIVVRAERLSLANAGWSRQPEMASADLLRMEVPFRSLLRWAPVMSRIDVVRPALLLERRTDGSANWTRPQGKSKPARRAHWTYGELRVHEGRFELHDAPLKTDLQ